MYADGRGFDAAASTKAAHDEHLDHSNVYLWGSGKGMTLSTSDMFSLDERLCGGARIRRRCDEIVDGSRCCGQRNQDTEPITATAKPLVMSAAAGR